MAAYRAGVEARLKQAETERAEALVREAEQRKRRRTVQVAGGVIAVVLLAGLGVSLWQMSRAVTAEGQANQNAQQAQNARTTAVQKAAAATAARRDLALTLADSYTTLGLTAGDRNDPAAAAACGSPLWAVRQSEGDPEREFHNRVRYRNWAAETFTPVAALQPTHRRLPSSPSTPAAGISPPSPARATACGTWTARRSGSLRRGSIR